MSTPVVFSLLWHANQSICVELAQRHGFDIATPPGALAPEHIKAIQSCGRRYISLDPELLGIDPAAIQIQAKERFDKLKELLPKHIGSIVQGELGERISHAMLGTVSKQIGVVMYETEMLDAMAARENIVAVLLNENDLPPAKTAALWAKQHTVPSFVVSHGAGIGEAYTVTSAVVADYLLFVGERGTEPFTDVGFPRERTIVCGNPGWDGTPGVLAIRDRLREQIRGSMNLQPDEKVIVFGTTWNAKLTALIDVRIFQDTLEAFFRGCCVLRDMGIKFRAVIKDRPSNAEYGRAESERIARAVGFCEYSYATGDMMGMLLGADLFVGYDTSAFVESMIAGVPAIDIWAPSSWMIGPALDRSDGVAMVEGSDPPALANEMRALLTDEEARRNAVQTMTAALPRFSLQLDGQAARRSADAIAERLPRTRTTLPTGAASLADLVDREPQVVIDISVTGSGTVQALKAKYPHARYLSAAPDDFTEHAPAIEWPADVVVLEDVLERMYDPWRFLQLLHPLVAAGGRIVASIPNARNFSFLSSMVQGAWEYGESGQRDKGRLRFFTRKTIGELFSQTGYAVRRIEPVYDPAVSVPQVPQGASFDVNAGPFVLKSVTARDADELRTLEFLVEARRG